MSHTFTTFNVSRRVNTKEVSLIRKEKKQKTYTVMQTINYFVVHIELRTIKMNRDVGIP